MKYTTLPTVVIVITCTVVSRSQNLAQYIPKIVVNTLVNAALSQYQGFPTENKSGCGVVGEQGNKSFSLGTNTSTEQDQRLHTTSISYSAQSYTIHAQRRSKFQDLVI